MDGPEAPGPRPDAVCGDEARGTRTEGRPAPEEGPVPSAPDAGPPPAFTSSFSFIRRSLRSAPGEWGEAEGCPPARAAEGAGASAASPEGPPQDPGRLSPPNRPGGEGAAGRWDPLLRECEPLLQGCLLGLRRRLEVSAIRRTLQKLQEKAVEEEDYDKAEVLQHRLEALEEEEEEEKEEEEEEEELSLPFQLPSRQPALRSLLVHLGAQAEAALHRAAQQPGGEDPQDPLRVEPPAEDLPGVSVARRDQLLQEKQQLQEEMAALQARLSALAARDQQLSRELALQQQQQQRLRWWDCDLQPLLDGLTPGELQEVLQAARDTLAAAGQTPLPAGPPETTRSLQGKLEALSRSLKELSAKVCGSQRLCGSLRRSLQEIEAQLPALLEAKALAVAEAGAKEAAQRQLDALEDRLRGCTCPLLRRVWEADGEACRLLIRSLQPPEPRGEEAAGRRPLRAPEERTAPPAPSPGCAAGGHREEPPGLAAALAEKCQAIGRTLRGLEGRLHAALQSQDEALLHALRTELRLVKETLQAMLPQLQPPGGAGDSGAAPRGAAGVRGAQA